MRRTVTRIAVLGLALLLAGCGARADRALQPVVQVNDAADTPSRAATDPTATDGSAASASPPSLDGDRTVVAASAGPTPTRWPYYEPDPNDPDADMVPTEPDPDLEAARRRHNKVLRLRVSAACVHPGDMQIVSVYGPKRAHVSLGMAFSDDGSHNLTQIAQLDDAGRFDWQVVIPHTVPQGNASVGAAGSGPSGDPDERGTADASFTVVERGTCG